MLNDYKEASNSMRTIKQLLLFALYLFACTGLAIIHATERSYVPFRKNDPASDVRGVNVIHGCFTAKETDLVIPAPDPLILTRFYSSSDELRTTDFGGWRIFPQCVLIVGQHPDGNRYAVAGERSGEFLTYTGQEKDSLKIDMVKDGIGMVNTYADEMGGQTNLKNNRLQCNGDTCELVLGDGTKRIYRETSEMPDDPFGRKIPSVLFSKVSDLKHFQLISEKFPSGNVLLFTYDNGRLSFVEIKDSEQKKLHASIHFDYAYKDDQCVVTATTSDERKLEYHFQKIQLPDDSFFLLQKVNGTHSIPVSYEYEIENRGYVLKKKVLPEGRFLAVEYDAEGRVKLLKEPPAVFGESEIIQRFSYSEGFTEVFNAKDLRTRYLYDSRQQLTAIEQFNIKNELYRIDYKFWGESEEDCGMLKSFAVADGNGHIFSQRAFKYDDRGNIGEEWDYGNLTGDEEVFLNLDEKGNLINENQIEQHVKTYKYSKDGFNLLTEIKDCKGNRVLFGYITGTNLLTYKFIEAGEDGILRRTFYYYNQDGACNKIIEDDGSEKDAKQLISVNERHITLIQPRENFPGVGLPEVIEEKALDIQTKKDILVRKLIHSYFPQGHLLSTQVYDDKDAFAFTTSKTYTSLGQIGIETDPEGRVILYDYDGVGNQIQITIPYEKKTIEKKYDLRNRCYQITESAEGLQAIEKYGYDNLGRKISSTDRFGQLTEFDYDEFGRLEKVTYPSVLDEYENSIQPIFSYTHDIFGNVLSATDPKGYITTRTYNIRGSPTQIQYPDGTSELFKYDPEGSLHRSLTRENKATVHEYDYLGRISYQETSFIDKENVLHFLKGHSYEYYGFRVIEERETEGIKEFERITRFKHDPAGRITAVIQYDGYHSESHPSSRKAEFIYDGLGREIRKKIWFGPGANDYSFECSEFDFLGQIREKRAEDAEGRILLQRGFDYDASGHCIEEYTYPDGQRQTLLKTAYDPFGEPIYYSDGSGNETTVFIDYGGQVLRKTLIDPLSTQEEIIFDALGRLVSTIKRDAQGVLLSSQEIQYDASGNKAVEINENIWQGQSTDIQTTRWIYGPMDRLDVQIEAEGCPEEKRTQFFYDRFGRLDAKILPGASAPLTYAYNKQGFIRQIEYKAAEKEQCILNRYSYDGSGNIISAKGLNGKTVERDYDVFGQITEETIVNDYYVFSLHYGYDRKGRLVKIRLPDKSSISYEYDGFFGRGIKRLSPSGKLLYHHTYDSYETQGRLAQETGLAGSRIIDYDNCNRQTAQKTDYFSEQVPEQGYDPLGNLLKIEKKGIFPLLNGSYTYDSLSQISSEQTENYKIYSNDSLGNHRLVQDEELLYNSLNQLTASAQREYSFAPQGNLRRKVVDKTETRFTSDILSRLITIEKNDGTALHCGYDPFGSGQSGAKDSRPELNELMADARKRKFDSILVWRFDRFARSTKHLLLALEEFRSLGIQFISYQENIDTSSPLGQALFTIVSAVAQLERDLIRERVSAGIRNARANGNDLGVRAG